MLGFLYRLFIGRFKTEYCQHNFDTITTHIITGNYGSPIGVCYVLECEKCGEITQRRISV